jgi:hypothetical protein
MTVEIGAEAVLFQEKEYISGICIAVRCPVNHRKSCYYGFGFGPSPYPKVMYIMKLAATFFKIVKHYFHAHSFNCKISKCLSKSLNNC